MNPPVTVQKYLELKEFLARNPAVKPRTFTRWKKRGLIDCIQPGGPHTQILVPEDALMRMERRNRDSSQAEPTEEQEQMKSIQGRVPEWKKKLNQRSIKKEPDGQK